MKIDNLTIQNFRGLRNIHISELDKNVNLFVGVNGAGKSSILDALSLIFSWYIARMLSAKGRGRDIPKDDIGLHSPSGCLIKLDMDNKGSWKLYRSLKYRKTDKSDLTSMNQYVSEMRDKLEEQSLMPIPIVAYYDVHRVIPNSYPRMPKNKSEFTQLDAYKNTLSASNLFSDFFNWFRLSEDYENELFKEDSQFQDHGLKAVREAIGKVFPEYSELKVSRRPLALTMKKGEEKFKINQLSDGEKCYISLVCDIARRLAIANPDPNQDPLCGAGIVMIDEIELHLHPKWQQSVLSKLVNTFPNCQFFITSHSPIVASDAAGRVFAIRDGEIVEQQTYGKLSANILSSVFDLSMARNLYVQSILDSAYEDIKNGNADDYEKKLRDLTDILGADDPDIAGLRIEKARRDKMLSK